MKLVLIAALFLSGLSAAPEEKPASPAPGEAIKFIELKYLGNDSSDRLFRVITLIQQLLKGKAQIHHDPILRTVALQGTPEGIASAEQLLRRFDTPAAESKARQIQLMLMLHLVEASDQPASEQKLPQELVSATDQLRTAFGYKSFRLVDTIVMQARQHTAARTEGVLMNSGDPNVKTIYTAQFKALSYSEPEKILSINGFQFDTRVPVGGPGWVNSAIHTSLTLKEGQKLVLGKLSKDQTERGLFLIVSFKAE